MANLLQKIGVIIGNLAFYVGLWQFDLLCSGQIWRKGLVFLLPFNIPISAEFAYCLFCAGIILGNIILNISYWFWE